jgi:hypothetical protein
MTPTRCLRISTVWWKSGRPGRSSRTHAVEIGGT